MNGSVAVFQHHEKVAIVEAIDAFEGCDVDLCEVHRKCSFHPGCKSLGQSPIVLLSSLGGAWRKECDQAMLVDWDWRDCDVSMLGAKLEALRFHQPTHPRPDRRPLLLKTDPATHSLMSRSGLISRTEPRG